MGKYSYLLYLGCVSKAPKSLILVILFNEEQGGMVLNWKRGDLDEV